MAWIGLVLLIVSAIWWQMLLPPPPSNEGDPVLVAPGGPIRRVIIDAGHGGDDSGAMHGGLREKDLTLDVARRLEQAMWARGLETILTRTGDETVSLMSRAAIANEERDCVFVSIHFDEGSRVAASGVQTFYAANQTPKMPLATTLLPFLQRTVSDSNNLESQSLAGFIQEALVVRTQALNRGTRAEQFYVIANVRHPAVLVEGGFLTNTEDIIKLTSDEYRQQLAVAISDGIMRYREIAVHPQRAEASGEAGN